MTVLLVLFFICFMIGLDAVRQHIKNGNMGFELPHDAIVHSWGVTMADGGEKIKNEEKK